jgi:NADH-quinone oxidoreductase subunit L
VWIIPVVSSLFVPIIGRLGGKTRNYFALLVGLITTIFALSMIPDVFFNNIGNPDSTVTWIPLSGINLGIRVDPLSVFFASLVAFFSLVVIIYSLGYMAHEDGLNRYYFFILLFMGSMIALVMADNFFQMFVFWEVIGLCSYSLVSFWHRRPEAVKAGVRVFIITRVGDICLLAAILLLYASLGSFSFTYTMVHIAEVQMPTLTAVAFFCSAEQSQNPLNCRCTPGFTAQWKLQLQSVLSCMVQLW